MYLDELRQKVGELAEEALQDATSHKPEEAGLDRRACDTLYRGPDFLAIDTACTGTMSYYGGFEYVDKECVMGVGNYVFYSTEDSRVQGHWDRLEPEEENEICSACNGSGEGMYDGARCPYCHGCGTLTKGEDDEHC